MKVDIKMFKKRIWLERMAGPGLNI